MTSMATGDRQSAVILAGVAKTFVGGAVGVEQVDLRVTSGEMLTLVGASGSGKTTTLRLVAGLERLSRGSIRVGGCDVSHWAPHRRRVALVGQRPVLHPRWTVERHLEFAWALRQGPRWGSWGWWRQLFQGIAKDARYRCRRDEVVAAWGLERFLSRRAVELSSGQQQQVALARAMMGDPEVYLLDEPFSSMDLPRRLRLRWQLRQWQRRLGRTVLYVTHDHGEALALGDRVAVMRGGRIVQVGTPAEVYRRPLRQEVAESLGGGTLNFVGGALAGASDEPSVVTPYFQIKLSAQPAADSVRLARRPASTLTLAIRPEDLVMERDGAVPENWPRAQGRIVGVEQQGDFDWVRLVLEPSPKASVSAQAVPADVWLVRTKAWSDWREGERVEVRWNASNLFVFDLASGDQLTG